MRHADGCSCSRCDYDAFRDEQSDKAHDIRRAKELIRNELRSRIYTCCATARVMGAQNGLRMIDSDAIIREILEAELSVLIKPV